MTLLPRRPWCAWSAIAVLLVLVLTAATAAAQPVRAGDLDPDPTGDPFLDMRFHSTAPTHPGALDADEPADPGPLDALPNGTILANRAVRVRAPLGFTADFEAWQLWFKTTDATGAPISSVTTILKPVDWNGHTVSNNYAIDSVGLKCNPSYQLTHETSLEVPDITRQLLWRGYAVVLTDYQGPKMAYAHGPTQGREVLDGIRAALAFPDAGLAGSPIAMIGYSGGAIATVWAAQMQPWYAPELVMRGAAAGGTPADLSLLRKTMDGQPPASVLYLMAVIGIARVYPGAFDLLNAKGAAAAQLAKNLCAASAAYGVVPVSLASMTRVDPYKTPLVRQIYRDTKAGGAIPTMPIYLWHGLLDQWIPLAGAQQLQRDWQAGGASVTMSVFPCDHITCAFFPAGVDQIDRWMGRATG
ncbi:lipase family protein [Nocardia sp. NPDC052566]|uniref:lipase family protein n=1 Tax=Nocardia sp. NPDC052566 TaxID=3364330 RepID=UPI0037C6A835